MKHEIIWMTAEQLGVTEAEREGLVCIKGELERGELRHAKRGRGVGFNMDYWCDCGTVQCIGGWLALRGQLASNDGSDVLGDLFFPSNIGSWGAITPAQAARAIGNFLASGHPRWDEAVCG